MFSISEAETYARLITKPETPLLRDVRETTTRELAYDTMLSGPLVGSLLRLLVGISGARNVLEVGTFTGYATLQMALALPAGGIIRTCESNEKYAGIARRFFERYREEGGETEIRILPGLAMDTIRDQVLSSSRDPQSGADDTSYPVREQKPGALDFIFLDADKEHYPEYYEMLLPELRPGGLMVIDNAFWGGDVWNEKEKDRKAAAIDQMNRMISGNPEVENVMLTVRDGLHLLRKIR